MINYSFGRKQTPNNTGKFLTLLKKSNTCSSNKTAEILVNMKKVINHCKTQGICNKINIDFKNKIEDHVTQYKTFLEENQITDQPFTISEVKKSIHKLKTNKSAGPDLIPNEILIHVHSSVTCKSIVKLFLISY
jgi:hypothetical protein